MLLIPLLVASQLVLSTTASIADAPAEKTFKGEEETTLWITSKKPKLKIETHHGFTFHLDFATHGALSLAHVSVELKTKPKGLMLYFDPSGKIMLSVDYDKEAKALRVLLAGSKEPLCKIPLALSVPTTRVLLRQRQQIALYAIPQSGDHVVQVWQGGVGYMLEFRNASQYELCTNLKIDMGKRSFTFDEFHKGIKLTALDEVEDVTVSGVNPAGSAFKHRYTFDYEAMQSRLDGAYNGLLKAMGNTLLEGTGTDSKSSPSPESGASPSSTASPTGSPAPAASAAPENMQ